MITMDLLRRKSEKVSEVKEVTTGSANIHNNKNLVPFQINEKETLARGNISDKNSETDKGGATSPVTYSFLNLKCSPHNSHFDSDNDMDFTLSQVSKQS
jgi:hypothetical protein